MVETHEAANKKERTFELFVSIRSNWPPWSILLGSATAHLDIYICSTTQTTII